MCCSSDLCRCHLPSYVTLRYPEYSFSPDPSLFLALLPLLPVLLLLLLPLLLPPLLGACALLLPGWNCGVSVKLLGPCRTGARCKLPCLEQRA